MDYKFSKEVQDRILSYPLTTIPGVTEKSPIYSAEGNSLEPPPGPRSIPLANTEAPGYTSIYRSSYCPDRLVSAFHPSISTVYESFKSASIEFADRDCLGKREYNPTTKSWGPYKFISYAETAQLRSDFGSGLVQVVERHSDVKGNYAVASYAPNSINWVIADLACQCFSLPTVCLYDTLGPDTSEYILQFTKAPVIIASIHNIPTILKIKSQLPDLAIIVCIDSATLSPSEGYEAEGESKKSILKAWAEKENLAFYTFDDVLDIGRKSPRAHVPPSPSDIYAINFTSGTTGNPKGAIITHDIVIASIACVRVHLSSLYTVQDNAVLSFLPLAHIYERINMVNMISSGIKQAYPHGPITELFDDIQTLKPTFVCGVPRIFNRLVAALKNATIEAPGVGGAISRRAFAAKLDNLRKTGSVKHAFWDRVWSSKIRAKVGFDNVKILVSGSAPMAAENIEFLKVALGAEFLQGYGLTESVSGITLCSVNDKIAGSIGPIMVSTEFRLRDAKDVGYSVDDKPFPRGEIMLRGPQIFKGYLHNEEKTLEAFDKDGFFYTGDVGTFDADGRLFIIDRVKNFFKLAQGEYVGPEKIEGIYTSTTSLLTQIFVHGNSLETYLVAIGGVNIDAFAVLASKVLGKKISIADAPAFLNDLKVRKAFVKAMNVAAESAKLKGFEKVRNITLFVEPLNLENGTVTPTLKVKRNDAAKFFDKEISAMYKEGPLDQLAKL